MTFLDAIGPTPVRVLVAVRHGATRAGVRVALERCGLEVAAECADAASATAAAVRTRADVCLVDLDLPGGGLEAVGAICALPLAPRVVMFADRPDERLFAAGIAAGAAGFLLKDIEGDELGEQLRHVAEGGTSVAPVLLGMLVDEYRSRSRGPRRGAERLTERERQVLELLAEGLTTKEVAFRLRLSPTTVRRHVSSAVRRLGMAGRRQAVEWVRGVQRDERK